MVNIGKNIMRTRKELGMTQEELARRVGYKTKSAINKIELGVRDLPQKKIVAFAQALGVSPGHLMGWDQEPEDLGALAAKVLQEPALLRLVQDYLSLDQSEQATVSSLVSSLAEKKKADA